MVGSQGPPLTPWRHLLQDLAVELEKKGAVTGSTKAGSSQE
jgi:hypothetical protein